MNYYSREKILLAEKNYYSRESIYYSRERYITRGREILAVYGTRGLPYIMMFFKSIFLFLIIILWLTSKMQRYEGKKICIYDFYSHNKGGWLKSIPWTMGKYICKYTYICTHIYTYIYKSIYTYTHICIFHFQCHGHWWPGNTRSQGIRDHDTDLFTSDSRRMLEVNISNYDYWKHTHIHIWLYRTNEDI